MPASVITQAPVIDRGLGDLWLADGEGVSLRLRKQLPGNLWDNLTGRALVFVCGAFRKAFIAGAMSTERRLLLTREDVAVIAASGARIARVLDETGEPVRRWWRAGVRFRDGDPGHVAEGALDVAEAVLEDAIVVVDLGSASIDEVRGDVPAEWGSLERIKVIIDRAWHDIAAYGGDGTGLSSNNTVFAAVRTMIGPTGGAVFHPPGRWRYDDPMDQGGLQLIGTEGFKREVQDYTQRGSVLVHNGDQPLFQATSDGWGMDGLIFYDPRQTGATALPVPRQPLITTHPSWPSMIDITVRNCVPVNIWDWWKLPDGAKMGDVRFISNRGYVVNRVWDLEGYVPEKVFETGNLFSPGIYQSKSIFAYSAMLARYTASAGIIRRVNTASSVDGWSSIDGTYFGYGCRDYIPRGLLNICSWTGEKLDGVARALEVTGDAGVIGATRTGGLAYIYTYDGFTFPVGPQETSAFRFDTTGRVDLSMTGMAGEFASGRWVEDTGTGPTRFKLSGGHLRNWGIRRQSNTREGIYADNPNAQMSIKPGALEAYMPGSVAVAFDQIRQATISTDMVGSGASTNDDTGVHIRETVAAASRIAIFGSSTIAMLSGISVQDDRAEGVLKAPLDANDFDGAVILPGVVLP